LTLHAKYDTACTIKYQFEQPWQALKGILSKTHMFPNCPTSPIQKHINLKGIPKKNSCMGVIDNACTIFAHKNRSYLREFEAEFKKALPRESGA
jgi:hypothetical protein